LRPSLLEEFGLKSFCKMSGGKGLPGAHRSEYKRPDKSRAVFVSWLAENLSDKHLQIRRASH
jgi:DNA primase